MAEVIGLFNRISGRVGNVIYVRRGGKTFIKKLPIKRTTPYSKLELEHHSRFGFTCKIASRICQTQELKHFWNEVKKGNQSSHNRIFKENFRLVDPKDLTGFVRLTPDFGFNLDEPMLLTGKSGISLDCKPIKEQSSDFYKKIKYIMAAGIVILRRPRSKSRDNYEIMSFKSEKITFGVHSLISIQIPLGGAELKSYKGYSLKTAYAVLVALDEKGNPFSYSGTTMSHK
jgi:hypothetical protein